MKVGVDYQAEAVFVEADGERIHLVGDPARALADALDDVRSDLPDGVTVDGLIQDMRDVADATGTDA